ncbi:MAG TPA: hypothetical protein QGG47_06970 [Acidobacteriota bacterium]|nr:hypothetical protein [Acidobacteriota bacterium]
MSDRVDAERTSRRHLSIVHKRMLIRAGKGSKLVLHGVITRGDLRVQLTEPDGALIPGLTFDDCVPVSAEGPTIEVEWLAAAGKTESQAGLVDLSRLNGRTVRVEISADQPDPHCRGATVISGEPRALRVGGGPHLFVDDRFVAESENLARTTTRPTRRDAPLIDGRPDPCDRVAPGAIMRDPSTGLFRMWNWKAGNNVRSELVHRISDSPCSWPQAGETVLSFDGFGSKLIDTAPYCDDELRRFRFAYFNYEAPMGTCVAFSADGIDWQPYEGNPVLPFYPIGNPRWADGVGDITDPFWDPINRRYAAFVKMPSASDREFGLQSRSIRDGLGIRLTALTTSSDFVHWTQPRRVFVPDEHDEGVTEFYGAEVLSRGDTLIAFVRILRDDLAADRGGPVGGIGYTTIATSHDGKSWQRHRDVFLDPCPLAGSFDHAFAWVYATLEWQDLVYLYYAAYDEGHKTGHRSIGLATLQRDRYVALAASGSSAGRLLSPLLVHTRKQVDGLWLNADARGGELRVQVLGADDRVVEGLSFNDCRAISGDSLSHRVEFAGEINRLCGQPFRLELSVLNAAVYAFSFALDAS